MSQRDIIAAVATPPGKGAIGVIRLSGAGSAEVLSQVFEPKRVAKRWLSHKLYHGRIVQDGRPVDEVMAVVLRAPRSYTAEETVEIYTHGGVTNTAAVLSVVLGHGARPAHPGEFTQRAFLNGRLDLAQAEAVVELINAKTNAALSAGLRQLSGAFSRKVEGYRDIILKWIAHIELSIDYPEHGSEAMNLQTIRLEQGALLEDLKKIRDSYQVGRVLSEGVRTVIVGRPNVGKSSLLNAVLGEDRAIVTDIPGTTRDVLTEPVRVGGVPLLLSDTAGIRETREKIEKLGVDKSLAQIKDAELVLWVLDRSSPPRSEDFLIAERLRGKTAIALLNKCDLPAAEGWPLPLDIPFYEISAKDHTGLDKVYAGIEALFLFGLENNVAEADIVTRARHYFLLGEAIDYLQKAGSAIDEGLTEDLVSMDLNAAYRSLGAILGREVEEDILDRIFSEFCVGK